MDLKKLERERRYVRKLRQRAWDAIGVKCDHCQGEAEQFAHSQPTALKGRGRGRKRRYMDVLKNTDKYIPLCKRCHAIMDNPDDGSEIPD